MSCSNGIRIIVWIYLLIIKGFVVHGQTPGPNAVALINGQTMLDCLTIDPTLSNWRRTTDGSSNALVIATGCNVVGNNAAYYRTEQPGGNICRLIIANVTMQQAGVYACNDGGSIVYRSLVTVIDPYASVVVYNHSGVVVNDQLNISCSINYTGPQWPAPSLHPSPYWTTSPGQIYTSDTYNTSTNVVTLVATVTVQKYTVPIFQCKTVFNITGNTNTYNPVPPADNFTVGNTTELDVQYPPENISINSTVSTKDKCVSTPVNLICTADANPPARYSWVDIINNSVTIGAVKPITSGGQYQCLASNDIRGKTNNDTKTVNETSCYPVNNMTISGSNCENNTCTCTGNQSSIMLTCMAVGTPNPNYKWSAGVTGYTDFENGTIEATINGNYRCISTNEYGGITYNATGTMGVSDCQKGTLLWLIFFPIYVGVCWILGVAFVTCCGYSEKKSIYNEYFPFLERMLPCMNHNANENKIESCGWIFLYILMVTTVGLFIIPIMFCTVQCRTAVKPGDDRNDLNTDNSENKTPSIETKTDVETSKEIEENEAVKETLKL